MKTQNTTRKRRAETGIALLISIFVLLLISVVAIALIVSSGTESALAGNYRSSTGVYYAALSGLEEARGRLLPKNPSSFKNTAGSFLPAPGATLPIGAVAYVLNPGPTESAGTLFTTYPDAQYETEFGPGSLAGATVTTTNSVWNRSPLNALNVPGPLYKWVRINAVSEKSLNIDVDADSLADSTTPLYYDGAHFSNSSAVGPQVLEITSFATLANGSQKILQYLVAANLITLPPFPAAITLVGRNVDYSGPFTGSWVVTGNDTINLGSCTSGPSVYAIGFSNNDATSQSNITASGAVATPPYKFNYTGQGGTTPNVHYIGGSIPANFQTPAQIDAFAQSISQYADVPPIPGPATGSDLPAGMSAANMMTVVVNGNLDLTGWHNTGYGLLLVTGNLTYDPDAFWYGIVLVIGQGYMTGSHSGSGQFVGGLLLAKTRDTTGTLFPGPSLPSWDGTTAGSYGSNIQFANGMGGIGVTYSSCWIQAAQPTGNYKIISFHEITQ
jgi:hypothetical protein